MSDRNDPLSEDLLLRIMQEISRDAVLSVDALGRVTSWNQGAEALLGYTAAEMVGRHFAVLLPPDLRERGEAERLVDKTEELGFLRDYETRRVTKDGRQIHVSLTRMRLLDPQGRLVGATAILRDITARKRLEEELIRARTLAAIGEFSARIAHEVRNPLTGMSSALALLAESFPAGHRHHPLFEEVERQIRRIDRVLDDLLTFTRHRRVDRQRIDLVPLLERVLGNLLTSGELAGVEIHRHLAHEAVVWADPTMLEDSLFNLIHNAAHSLQGSARPVLTVALKPGPVGVAITITDTGPGIPADRLDKVFDPFFTTKVHGTGLGLPITRKHVEAHGGRLRVRSAPGKLTTFEILLPRDAVEAAMPEPR